MQIHTKAMSFLVKYININKCSISVITQIIYIGTITQLSDKHALLRGTSHNKNQSFGVSYA